MREARRLELELDRLVRPGSRGLDLADLMGQEVDLALAVALALLQGRERRPRRPQAPVLLGQRGDGPGVLDAGEPIEERGLGRGRQQPDALVLAVELDEVLGDGDEGGDRRELAADPGGAPAVGRDGAREDELTVLRPALDGRAVGCVEPRLHARGARARSDERRGGAPAERERESHGHEGLAGPRLAAQHVEAGMQLEVEVLDHAEAADVEIPEH
jgi:hypothetical protein